MKQLKPLLPLGDATVTDFIVSTFRSTGIDVFLVVGHRQEEVKAGIKRHGITIIYNQDYAKGMFSSVRAGVRELGRNYQAFFLLPVDIPMVRATTIKQIMNAGLKNPENIIYPLYKGKRGHPPLIPTGLIPGIIKWEQEGGLKTFLKSHEDIALDVPVNDRFILFDIDTPEDYKALQKHYRDYNRIPEYSK